MYTTNVDAGNFSDSQDLATWNRQRSVEELRNFVNMRHSMLPDSIDIE